MASMVELRKVSKKFGSFTALEEVSFDIAEGEFMTFLGPSGCGKTTCLRLISGFENPSTGEVFIAGKNVTHDPPYRRSVNQVFQSYALFPHLSVYENISFGLRMKKLAASDIKRRVDRVVEMTSLQEFADRKPAQLSGGQRQRVALARAVVCEPKVLLLDEPLSALDAKLRTQMRAELKQLQKRLGITFVFVTHDQEEALTMSDRIAVISCGRVEQIGTVNEIYYQPATRFVATFIGETNIVEAEIVDKGADVIHCQIEGGMTLAVRPGTPAAGSSVLLSLRPEKIRLYRSRPQGQNVFSGRIVVQVFKGAVNDLTVAVSGGLELRALIANDGQQELVFQEGEEVFCRIQPEDINIVSS
jgi:spermidine/putrescine transport system ATP-binding protein